jgi:hypothetical protein
VLSAVVIAVGLVFVSRALASEVKALRTVEEAAVVAWLAQNLMRELEGQVQDGRAPSRARSGTFDAPNTGYQWALSAAPISAGGEEPSRGVVTLVIRRTGTQANVTAMRAVWPLEYIPGEWL